MDGHIKVVGVLWIISGVIGLLFALGIFGILFGVSYIPDMEHEASIILRTIGLGFGILFAICAVPEIIGGIGLIRKHNWGRILVLAVSFLNIIWFPLWTALGIYSIIILFNQETIELLKKR